MKLVKISLVLLMATVANGCFKLDTDSTQQCMQVATTCSNGATLSGCYQGNVIVPAGGTCNFTGIVTIKSGATLTINQGATMKAVPGLSPASSVFIDPGAKINAIGTAASPITFTSGKDVGQRAAQDWGGLLIRGRASHNFTTDQFLTEFGDGVMVGGKGNDSDNSGTIQYVRIEFAGRQATATKEFNAIAFEAVGSGTTVDYVHSHAIGDDAIEFFGGTVNVKHFIATAYGDDGFDWTYGWRGKAQYVIIHTAGNDGTNETNGIEADNSDQPNGDTLAPKSSPTLANFTMTSNGVDYRDIMRLRRGTEGKMYNFYIGNYCDKIRVENTDAQQITTGGVASGALKIQGVLLEGVKAGTNTGNPVACAAGDITGTTSGTGLIVVSGGGAAATAADTLISGATVANNFAASGFTPANWVQYPASINVFQPANLVTTNAVNPTTLDSFFTAGTYLGAMDNVGANNWLSGGWVTFPAN